MDEFDEADLLSLAIESAEKESESVSSAKKSPKSTLSNETPPVAASNSPDKNEFFVDDDDILAEAFKCVEESRKISGGKKKINSLIGVDLNFEETGAQEDSIKPPVKKSNGLKIEKSVVHSGDTDSSDDEDNKYFEEVRYNTYGKTIKTALKDVETSSGLVNRTQASSWKGKPQVNATSFLAPEKKIPSKQTNEASYDPVFGIRIVNPLVSSQTIKEKMAGRTPINFMKLKSHVVNGDLKSDWVIAAVIVRKFPPRVSQKGSNYSNWIISDLKGCLKTASLFLFGRAHEDLWKTPSGTVLAILNPSVLNDNKTTDFEAKLSIKSGDQVMIWGKSKDLGQCNFRKKNGEICGTFVNVSECEFCVYHVQQEYKKFNSRAELQTNGKAKVNLRNKVLGKNEVFYGGKSFTAMPFMGKKAQNPKDKERLKGLGMPKCNDAPPEKMSIPLLQRSNKMFNLLPSGNSMLPCNPADEKRLSALLGKEKTNESVAETVVKNSLKAISGINTSNKEKKPCENSAHSNNIADEKRKSLLLKKENKSVGEAPGKSPSIKTTSLLNTPNNEKKLLLKNPGNEISFDLEVCSPKFTPPVNKVLKENTKGSQRALEKNRLQKRFSNLVSMTSDSAIVAKPVLSVPPTIRLSSEKSQISNALSKPLQTHSPKTEGINKTLPSPRKGRNENIPKQKSNSKLGLNEPSADEETLDPTNTVNSIGENLNNVLAVQRQKPSPKAPPNSGMSKAKLRALQFIKSKGPISKENPSGTEGSKKGIKRPLSPTSEEDNDKKPVLSERFLQLMNQKSIREDLVEAREIEQEFEYFDKMEKKDRLEEKMLNTFKVDCKAVRCLKCNYIWFSASDACKAEGHPIKVVDAVKRFFKCGKCSNRTISLTLIPLIPCKKCFSSNWVRAPMIREKLVKNDTLSIRGGEQKFVNGSITNGSLDLLVPD